MKNRSEKVTIITKNLNMECHLPSESDISSSGDSVSSSRFQNSVPISSDTLLNELKTRKSANRKNIEITNCFFLPQSHSMTA